MRNQVETAIATYVRPLVEADGGAIQVLDASTERVVVGLSGACAGCPGRPFTVAGVIEPALRKALGASIAIEVRLVADRP